MGAQAEVRGTKRKFQPPPSEALSFPHPSSPRRLSPVANEMASFSGLPSPSDDSGEQTGKMGGEDVEMESYRGPFLASLFNFLRFQTLPSFLHQRREWKRPCRSTRRLTPVERPHVST